MSWRSTPRSLDRTLQVFVALFLFAVAPTSAEAATAVTLVNPGGGAPWPGAATVSSPADVLNDPFTYNPNINFANLAVIPAGYLPNTAWNGADTLFIANNNNADNFWRTDVTLGSGQTLDFIDIWGRSDYAGAEQSRHQALTISFYNAPGGSVGGGALLATSPEYSGVTAKAPNNANGSAYGRFNVAGLLNAPQRAQVQSFEITHGPSNLNDFLLLTEIRAGSGAVTPPFPTLTINRNTGNAVLANGVEGVDLNFIAYDIQSGRGSLNASAWTSIADTGDGNSGGSIDGDVWVEFSTAGSFSSLSEGELPGGDGLTLSTSESINLGNIWRKSPYEDVSIQALKADGTFAPVLVEYVGNGGSAFKAGDMNFDGNVNAADWPIFRSGLGSTFDANSALTIAYQQGDLDGDRDSDIADFRLFEAAFDGANGQGALATLAGAVPEPSTLTLAAGLAFAVGTLRRQRWAARGVKFALLSIATAGMLVVSEANAQTFTLVAPPANPTTDVTANSEFSGAFTAANMFTDAALTVADLGVKTYTDADAQYAGVGVGPMHVFIDNGATINANWIAFAQRSGAIPTADRIGTMDFWFSNTSFGGVLPVTAPQATVKIDNPLGSTIKHHPLLKELSGRYVAVKMTIHDLSVGGSVNNIGGHEFRFIQGPSALVLQVDTATGAMTLKNNGGSAQAVPLDAYQISSSAGSLNPAWTGLGGLAGFPEGNGSGNGWETGGGSDSNLLVEAYLTGGSAVNIGASLPLGTGYNPAVNVQDLKFQYSYDNGIMTEGIIEYVSTGIAADFDGNGVVDGNDFLRWQRGYGTASGATKGQGDADNNGAVNAADLAIWKETFGAGASSAASAAVPEPSAFALVAVGAAAWGVGFRRRKAYSL